MLKNYIVPITKLYYLLDFPPLVSDHSPLLTTPDPWLLFLKEQAHPIPSAMGCGCAGPWDALPSGSHVAHLLISFWPLAQCYHLRPSLIIESTIRHSIERQLCPTLLLYLSSQQFMEIRLFV